MLMGVHVAEGDWEVVAVHLAACPRVARRATLRLVNTDSVERCRQCGGPLLWDVGGGPEGEMEAAAACPRCAPRPAVYDTAGGLA